ncbi:MAG: peptidase m23 [Parcubacteria group bacterium Athens0416_74]|nr:MAG: peptidase m23 [Parcubacteria group bacterium Athens0416_74]
MRFTALTCSIVLAALVVFPSISLGQSADELQQQIDANNSQIEALNKEIAQYESQLKATSQQKQTLQGRLNELDLQRKKLTAQITLTKNQIGTTQKQIQQLSNGIDAAQGSIDNNRAGLAESLRSLYDTDKRSLAISILNASDLTDAWQDIDAIAFIQDAVRTDIRSLAETKQVLTDTKTQAEEKRAQLVAQQRQLTTQQGSLDATRKAQNELLAQTKSQESAYQKIIAQKQAEKVQFEAALFELASKLEYTLDPSKVPSAGKGVLRWPLDNVFVTQQFGKTSSSGRLYKSGTHDGIDLRASIGTPVRASLTGTVLEVNHGAVRNCQYGKWVLVKHGNGLATLYAHLSDILVAKGQTVATGSVVGYAGDTGYATGPHLHFTVYLSDALSFKSYKCKSGTSVTVPLAPTNAYLNPLDYL